MRVRTSPILLIEPDAYLAGIYASKFSLEHLPIDVAESLVEARKKLRRKTAPRAIVLDVSIEGGKGFDFIRALREDPKTFALPIIVLTALGDRTSVGRAFAAGANEYLIKGHFVPIEAARKVRHIVEASVS